MQQKYTRLILTLILYIVVGIASPSVRAEIAPVSTNGKIVFSSDQDGDYEIYTIDQNGMGLQQLTSNMAYDGYPEWSPDGRKILFTSYQNDSLEIFVMNADGSNQTSLTPDIPDSSQGSWSPDGRKIVFTAGTKGIGRDVYVMDAWGSNAVNLTNNPDFFNAIPFWSETGTQIYFLTDQNYELTPANELRHFDLYGMAADGTNPTQLFEAGTVVSSISLSPDGNKILTSVNARTAVIALKNLDGSGEILLTDIDEDTTATFPDWSPDGEKIVYILDGNKIAIMNADGSGKQTILAGDLNNHFMDPDWQPVFPSVKNSSFTD